jgi:ribonucleoside-diphosphate reductase alpha chain
MFGPENAFSQQLHSQKYRADGESFDDYAVRYARATADSETHFRALLPALRYMRLLPAGRQQIAVGRPFQTTAFNCFVMGDIQDSMAGIMESLKESALTLRGGGGIGNHFGTIRPEGEPVRKLGAGAFASGPVVFMQMWDSMSRAIESAGRRRGAMMATLPVTHPDIRKFIHAKRMPQGLQPLVEAVADMADSPAKAAAAKAIQSLLPLQMFNVSVLVTDKFMEAVQGDKLFPLEFEGRSHGDIRALDLWKELMQNNWDYAEPGVLFVDRINQMSPLGYCENITATNPCGEQPLPAYGACLLGSLNITKYLIPTRYYQIENFELDLQLMESDARAAVRAFDRVIDVTKYPLPQQEAEAKAKRRMGVGVTGMANALEVLGHGYASESYLAKQDQVLENLQRWVVEESIQLAIERGPFPAFQADRWLAQGWPKTLPEDLREKIAKHGIRNGQLLSIAPTGTISLCADNISSGIEPVLVHRGIRTVRMDEGKVEVPVDDWAMAKHGVAGKLANEVSPSDHVAVLCRAQKWIDSAVSKTCNVKGARGGQAPQAGEISYQQFQDLYLQAWTGGAKGCTTFNENGLRMGIIQNRDASAPDSGPACYITEDGRKECS